MTFCVINPSLGAFLMLFHFHNHQPYESGISPMLWVRKMRLREVKWMAQGHPGNEGQTQDTNQAWTQSLCPILSAKLW